MARASKTEEALRRLAAAREEPTAAEASAEIGAALRSRSGHVVAAAARIVRDHELEEHRDAVGAALARLLDADDLAKSDPQCRAKSALADAARLLRVPDDDLLRRGARTVQLEPTYGGPVDTAGELRGHCVMALAAEDWPDAAALIAAALADRDPVTRIAGARAAGLLGRVAALPLLRLRALVEDEDPRVPEECFATLLAVDGDEQIGFVVAALDGTGPFARTRALGEKPAHLRERFERDPRAEVAESAALALGQSRRADAVDPLIRFAGARPEVGFTALAMLRLPAAWDHLLRIIATAREATAKQALRALEPWLHDPDLKRRVDEAKAARD